MDQKPLEASFHLLDPARAEQFAAELDQHLRFNEAGLIPAVAQDWLDGAVLMVAWMNAEAIERTLATGEVHYWSRSRQELWHKGATSGQLQKLRGLRYDCDADVLLLTIEQAGAGACHTGARSCFYEEGPKPSAGGPAALPPPADVCTELARVIEGRRDAPEPGSYTNKLLAGGDNAILKKNRRRKRRICDGLQGRQRRRDRRGSRRHRVPHAGGLGPPWGQLAPGAGSAGPAAGRTAPELSPGWR